MNPRPSVPSWAEMIFEKTNIKTERDLRGEIENIVSQRSKTALQMSLDGATYYEIGAEFGLSSTSARTICNKAARRLIEKATTPIFSSSEEENVYLKKEIKRINQEAERAVRAIHQYQSDEKNLRDRIEILEYQLKAVEKNFADAEEKWLTTMLESKKNG